jgi:hypothetical protein
MAGRRGMLVGALVALGLLAGGTAAQAAERQCVGAIGPETVRGDLVVPPGATCDLAGTRVRGSVYVREGAELVAEQAEVRGSIEAERDAFVDLVATSVGGTLALRDTFAVFVEGGSIAGNLESRGDTFLVLTFASIGGNVKVAGGTASVIADGLEVNGTLEAVGLGFFDLFDSTVNGNFYVRGAVEGAFLCGSTFNGDAEFTENRTVLTIGSLSSSCDGNTMNGNLKVERNQADSEISDNDVGGNLTCFDNAPPPTGGGNRVHGNREGQCAAL